MKYHEFPPVTERKTHSPKWYKALFHSHARYTYVSTTRMNNSLCKGVLWVSDNGERKPKIIGIKKKKKAF